MFYIGVLIFLSLSFLIILDRYLVSEFAKILCYRKELQEEEEKLNKENERLRLDNEKLSRAVEETIALYDLTKDICRTLDEEAIFNIFRSHINRNIAIEEFDFIKSETQLPDNKNVTVLPLKIHKNTIGYLYVRGIIRGEDKDRFGILGQQFLLGYKRALLYKEVQQLTITDGLTQVFNRRYFLERFNEELNRSKNLKLNLSFLMVDIDRFKSYNDHYGHLVGDMLLKDITKIIKEAIRQIDFMGRYGGEELSIILAETDKEQARFAAERIRQAVECKVIRAYDEELLATISVGIATFPDDASEAANLIDRSDQALYVAKQTGRNKVCVYKSK